MNSSFTSQKWISVATLELDDSEQSRTNLLQLVPSWVQIICDSDHSSAGRRQFEIMIKRSPLDDQQPSIISDLVAAIVISPEMFASFRLVRSEHWIETAASMNGVCSATA